MKGILDKFLRETGQGTHACLVDRGKVGEGLGHIGSTCVL